MTHPGGAFPLPTDTAHITIESRQYRLFRLDLGEGLPRVALKVGLFVFIPWLALCLLLGVPVFSGVLIWLGPPLMVTARAITRDEGGRLRIRSWGDRVWWLTRRHAPIVNAGTSSARPPQAITIPVAFMTLDLDAPPPAGATRKDPRAR